MNFDEIWRNLDEIMTGTWPQFNSKIRFRWAAGPMIYQKTTVNSRMRSAPKWLTWSLEFVYLGVSINGGNPKWMVYMGKLYLNGWFGVPPFMEISIWIFDTCKSDTVSWFPSPPASGSLGGGSEPQGPTKKYTADQTQRGTPFLTSRPQGISAEAHSIGSLPHWKWWTCR